MKPRGFDLGEDIEFLKGNLPHWRQVEVMYFVTFRLADSLPQDKLSAWKSERDAWLKEHPPPLISALRREFRALFPERILHWLDQGHGACFLARPDLRRVVEGAILREAGNHYLLDEFLVMPNHVHVIVAPIPPHSLSQILKSWKGFTAREINRRTGRTGALWQKESYDHIVRDGSDLERIREYIRDHRP